MKKQLLALLMAAVLSAVAFAGPSLNPWFEVASGEIGGVGSSTYDILPPTLDAGLTIEGMLSPAWFIDLGFDYADGNLLDDSNDINLGFDSNIGFDQTATVNTTGFLVYGCELTFGCDVTYAVAYPYKYTLSLLTPGFKALGYVGPLEVWAGVNLPWNTGNTWLIKPFFGMRVDFDINL